MYTVVPNAQNLLIIHLKPLLEPSGSDKTPHSPAASPAHTHTHTHTPTNSRLCVNRPLIQDHINTCAIRSAHNHTQNLSVHPVTTANARPLGLRQCTTNKLTLKTRLRFSAVASLLTHSRCGPPTQIGSLPAARSGWV